jgi:acetyl-CoA synthetase
VTSVSTDWPVVHKPAVARARARANLVDYATERASFTWSDARAGLDGLPGGGLNIAHEALDRHIAAGRGGHIALRIVAGDGSVTEHSYAALAALTNRFADALHDLGVGPGERVFALLPRGLEVYVTALGTLKNRSVFSPLFAAYGPEPVRQRLALDDARVLVTTAALYRRKVASARDQLPGLRHVLLVDDDATAGTAGFHGLLRQADASFTIPPTDPQDPALLHFTSGTTGTPKGALHVHEAVVAHHATAAFALDLRADDVFWCTADPGWVTGTSYGIVAPLTHGATALVDQAEFDALRWYSLLERQRVTVWYSAPTALRMLMRAGDELPHEHDLSHLRFIASVGEPLNPEVVGWSADTLDHPVHDNWWQTETGGIMIANFAASDIRPGSSVGRPARCATGRRGHARRRPQGQRRPPGWPLPRRGRGPAATTGGAVNDDAARAAVAAVLGRIAPEVELDEVPGAAVLRDELDLDSLDFLALLEGLCERTGVEIPERDYGRVATLHDLVAYLVAHS